MVDGTIDIALEIDDSGTDKQARDAATSAGNAIAKGLNDSVKKGTSRTGDEVGKEIGDGLAKTGGDKASQAGKTIGQRLQQSLSQINAGSSVAAGFDIIAKQAETVGSALTNYITKPAGVAATAVAGIVIGAGWNRLVAIDTARAKLTGLGHDAQSIDAIMQSANQSVLGTSYSLADAATVAAGAVAAGVQSGDELTSYLMNAGDAAAIAGTSFSEMGNIFNRVQTSGRAYTMELNLLADRGIPIFQWLADAAGVSTDAVREMAKEGEISSQMYFDAINQNIGGAAKIIGETSFMGAFDNVQAAIGRIGAAFLDAGGQGGGFFSQIQPLLRDFIELLNDSQEDATALGVEFGKAFGVGIEFIKEVVIALKEMTPEQREAAVQFIAIAVAAGPLLRIFGGIARGAATLSRGVETVGTAFQILGGKQIPASNKSMKNIQAAASVGKGALAGLAAAGVAVLVAEFIRLDQKQKNYVKATDGLVDTTRVLSGASLASGDAFRIQSERAEESGRKIGEIKPNIDGLLASQAALADSIRENNLEAQSSINELEHYQTTIDNLANSSNLSADEQAELQLAVQGVNDILGTAYKVTDDYTGKIYEQVDVEGELRDVYLESVDAIDELIDAKQREIEIEASRENSVRLREAQKTATDELAAAIIAEDEALQKFNDTQYANDEARAAGNSRVIEAKNATDDAKDAVEATSTALRNEEFRMIRLQQATEGTTSEIGNFLAGQDLFNSLLETNGYSLEDFQTQLENTGISTQQLETLSGPALQELALAYDGTVESILAYLDELGIQAPTKAEEAASGTVQGAEGKLKELVPAAGLIGNETVSALTDPFFEQDFQAFRNIVSGVQTALSPMIEAFRSTGQESITALEEPISNYQASGYATAVNRVITLFGGVPPAASSTAAFAVSNFDAPLAAYTAPGAVIASTNVVTTLGTTAAGASLAGGGVVNAFNTPMANYNGQGAYAAKDKAESALRSGNGYAAGQNMALGYANGMTSSQVLNAIAIAGARIVSKALGSVNTAQQSHSPARKAMPPGRFFTQGYAVGIEQETDFAVKTVDDMVHESLSALDKTVLQTRVLYGSQLYDKSRINVGSGGSTVIYQLNVDGMAYDMRQDVQTQVKQTLETIIRKA